MSQGVEIHAAVEPALAPVLSDDALTFISKLQRQFNPRRKELLAARASRQLELDGGADLQFLDSTREVRESDWQVAAAPADL